MIKVSRQRNKRSDQPSQKRFSLSAFGKDIELLVEPNNDVVDTDQGLSVERRTVGGTLEKEIHFPKGRFYVGHIASDPNAHVAVREIDQAKGHLVRKISSVTMIPIATNSTSLVADLNAFSIMLHGYSETIISLTLSLPECLMEFCKVALTFESVDKILWSDHSNENSLPVLSHDAICFSTF